MASLYDSVKVRLAASAMSSLTDELEENAVKIARESIRVTEPLKGQAAIELENRLYALAEKLAGICDDLDALQCGLDRYASALEAVDEKLKTEV